MAAAWVVVMGTYAADARDTKEPTTVHVVYGRLLIANDDPELDGGDFDIDMVGADAQKPFGGRMFKYGIEVGALFHWDSDIRNLAASSGSEGGTVAFSLDINSFLMDYYFGGYLSLEPAKWIRVFAGAGPLIVWGQREIETEVSDDEVSEVESDSGLGVGLYARTGLDIIIADTFGITAGMRINTTTLSFEDTAGEVDVEGLQYFGGFVYHF